MEASKKRILTRQRKKLHIRKKLKGTSERPRVSVFRTAQHIYAQAIDDRTGVTLASVSTCEKAIKEQLSGHLGNKASAQQVGKIFGERLTKKGVKTIVFDRNGFQYHGRVQSLAEGIREAGLNF